MQGGLRQLRRKEIRDAVAYGHAEVDLGQTELAAVLPHEAHVVGEREDGPGREAMALDGGDRRDGKLEQSCEQRLEGR